MYMPPPYTPIEEKPCCFFFLKQPVFTTLTKNKTKKKNQNKSYIAKCFVRCVCVLHAFYILYLMCVCVVFFFLFPTLFLEGGNPKKVDLSSGTLLQGYHFI